MVNTSNSFPRPRGAQFHLKTESHPSRTYTLQTLADCDEHHPFIIECWQQQQMTANGDFLMMTSRIHLRQGWTRLVVRSEYGVSADVVWNCMSLESWTGITATSLVDVIECMKYATNGYIYSFLIINSDRFHNSTRLTIWKWKVPWPSRHAPKKRQERAEWQSKSRFPRNIWKLKDTKESKACLAKTLIPTACLNLYSVSCFSDRHVSIDLTFSYSFLLLLFSESYCIIRAQTA